MSKPITVTIECDSKTYTFECDGLMAGFVQFEDNGQTDLTVDSFRVGLDYQQSCRVCVALSSALSQSERLQYQHDYGKGIQAAQQLAKKTNKCFC